jgi:hypothetical protein
MFVAKRTVLVTAFTKERCAHMLEHEVSAKRPGRERPPQSGTMFGKRVRRPVMIESHYLAWR